MRTPRTVFFLLALSFYLPPQASANDLSANQNLKKILSAIQRKYEMVEQEQAAAVQPGATESASSVDTADFPETQNVVSQPPSLPENNAAEIQDDNPSAYEFVEEFNESQSRFAVGEELILSLRLGNVVLGDIFAIISKEGVLVGLNEFFQLVDFAIDVDVDSVSADGWFISADNQFSLLPGENDTLEVHVDSASYTVSSDHFMVEDDIYVELAEIARWFEIETGLDEAQLALSLSSRVPFPIEQRMQRQQRQVVGNSGMTPSVLPVKPNGYQLFSAPLLDAQVSTLFTDGENASSYSVLSSQDAAYFSSQLFLYGNDSDSLVDARLTLSRESVNGGLLGPLDMTGYAFGDVTPVNIGAGNTLGLGRGFAMNNASDRLVDNRRVNLVGEIQVGWDLELYRNGVLIDNRSAVDDGRYEFNDLELGYGANDFELVFYGPQGQIERRVESFYVDSNVVDAGEGVVQFSAVESNRSVLGVGDSVDDPRYIGPLISAAYDYGVTDWFSFGVGASQFSPQEGDDVQQFAFKSNVVLGPWGLLNSVFQFDDDNRQSMLHSYRTQVSDISFDVTYRRDEILSEEWLANESLVQPETDSLFVRMSGMLFVGSSTPLSYQNLWSKTEFSSGNDAEFFQNSLGLNTRWGSFSHGLIWQRSSFAETGTDFQLEPDEWEVAGSLGYRTRIGKTFARVFSEYRIEPVSEMTSVGSTLNYPISNNFSSELRYTYDIVNRKDRYDIRLNWLGDALSLSGIAYYDEQDSWSLNLVARFGLGYDRDTNTFFSSGRSVAQSGAVVVRMYEDENLDNQYTEGENVLEDVDVKAVQAFREGTTDKEGLAVLKSLPSGQRTDIVVDESTLFEPGMMVTSEGFSVSGRAGLVQQFDIPVVRSGEVEGTLYWRNESGEEQVAPYVRIGLIDENGNTVASTRSEFDGYYLFTRVLPGKYKVQVDTSTGRQRGLTPERLKQVKISNRGDVIAGVDFVLRELKSADGYVANLGEFSSLGLLKLYLSLLSKRVDEAPFEDAFYYDSDASGRYVLGASYIEGQTEPSRESVTVYCEKMQKLDVKCSVEPLQIQY